MFNITQAKNQLVEKGFFSHSDLIATDFQTVLDLFILAGLFDCTTCIFFIHGQCNNSNWYGDNHTPDKPPCHGISYNP